MKWLLAVNAALAVLWVVGNVVMLIIGGVMAEKKLDYDPVRDEQQLMTILEFEHHLMAELVEFTKQMYEAGESPLNEEQKIKEHTFDQWMNSFRMWASW